MSGATDRRPNAYQRTQEIRAVAVRRALHENAAAGRCSSPQTSVVGNEGQTPPADGPTPGTSKTSTPGPTK